MANPIATLEAENFSAMYASMPELEDTERPPVDSPRTAPMKFTHPSGARPLDGYTIKRGVGRGGFGEVYFATSDAGKEVALKLIRRNLDVELRGVTQCLNLKHPNLIALYDIRTDGMGDQWVVMEYVSGESLEDLVARHPHGMPVDEALWWIRGVCAGVAYLHDHGIVHRDLKPGNIFYDEGTVKIGDYGLAKFISCSRRSGQTESVGTVHYMAPEIANGRYGREIDTYALGIILFELLTGKVPFDGESVGEVLMKHLTAEPDLSALTEPYRNIVERALAKDPALRIKNVGELVSLLPGVEAIPLTPQYATTFAVEQAPAQSASSSIAPPPDVVKRASSPSKQPSEVVEEPIWKAIRDAFSGENSPRFSPLARALGIFSMVAAVYFYGFGNTISLAVPLLVCYVIYYVIWSSLASRDSSTTTQSAKLANSKLAATAADDKHTVAWPNPDQTALEKMGVTQSPLRPTRQPRSTWRERVQRQLAAKPLREKISELLGSMLLAAGISALAAGVAPLLFRDQPSSEQIATYLWLAIVGTLGSWSVVVPSKLFEGKLEDQVPLRISLLILGMIVGGAAWLLSDSLMLRTPDWHEPVAVDRGLVTHNLLGWTRTASGVNPPIAIYLAYFAFLFLVPRWWRQTEYTRDTRISLWWVVVSVMWAWLLHIFWWFPQPLGILAAGVIAFATQLASPWMTPSQRQAFSATPENAGL
jgi:serine/threonine protein kinase